MDQTETFFRLDSKTLQARAQELRVSYETATPFPHAVIDELFPAEALERVLAEFPKPQEIQWLELNHAHSRKLATQSEEQMGEWTRHFLAQLNSSTFIHFLETLTGMTGLIPDPHLWGGGLHQIPRGGHLGIHADFNRHERLRLDRRLNLLLYLNKDWREEYGGHLELWNRAMTRCERRVLPAFNRCVIFSTSDHSFHGHPAPLTCPEQETRKSIALYYYTNGRPAEEGTVSHSTLYQGAAGGRTGASPSSAVLGLVKKIIPPILVDAYRRLRPRKG